MLIPSITAYSWEPPSLPGASAYQRPATATRAARAPSQRRVEGCEVIGIRLGASERRGGVSRRTSALSLDRPNRASALVRRRDRELGDAARGGLRSEGAGLGR